MNLIQISQLRETVGVPQGHEDDTMVSQRRERGDDGGLLPSTESRGRHKDTSVFARKVPGCPELASGIPEGLKSL